MNNPGQAPLPINFSDTTPAAPAGYVNVTWQADSKNPKNVSACVALAAVGGFWLRQADPQGSGREDVYLATPTDRVLVGVTTSDITDQGVLISGNAAYVVSAAANASVGGIVYDSGSGTMRVVSGKTGSGTTLPLAAYVNGGESFRVQTDQSLTLTSQPTITNNAPTFLDSTKTVRTDEGNLSWDSTNKRLYVGFGPLAGLSGSGQVCATGAGGFIVATANSDASTGNFNIVAGSYVSINAGKVGTGTRLPFAIFTGGAETMRMQTSNNVSIGATADNGFRLEVTGTAKVSSNLTVGADLLFPNAGSNVQWDSNTRILGNSGSISIYTNGSVLVNMPPAGGVTIYNNLTLDTGFDLIVSSGHGIKAGGSSVVVDSATNKVIAYVSANPIATITAGSFLLSAELSANTDEVIRVKNVNAGNAARTYFTAVGDSAAVDLGCTSSGYTTTAGIPASTGFLVVESGLTGGLIVQAAGGQVAFQVGGTSTNFVFTTAGQFQATSVQVTGFSSITNNAPIFANSSKVLATDEGNFNWDSTNKRLTIGFGPMTDLSGSGQILATGSGGFVVSTANSNASTGNLNVVAGSYVSINAGKTGSGTRLPFVVFTGGAETMRLQTSNNVSIGATADNGYRLEVTGTCNVTSTLGVGAGKFTVGSAGDLTKVNNVAYSWPASQGGASTVLQNDGSGNLSWAAAGSGFFTRAADGSNHDVYPTTSTDRILSGISSSDIADAGVIIGSNFLYAVSATVNASIAAIGYDSGSSTIRVASGKTGSGTYLPLAFLTNGSEAARFTTNGHLLIGTTTNAGTLTVSGGQIGGVFISSTTTSEIEIAISGGTVVGLLAGNATEYGIYSPGGSYGYSIVSDGVQLFGSSAGAPTTPASGVYKFYVDTNDSNKLKVKGPSGTVTLVAVA